MVPLFSVGSFPLIGICQPIGEVTDMFKLEFTRKRIRGGIIEIGNRNTGKLVGEIRLQSHSKIVSIPGVYYSPKDLTPTLDGGVPVRGFKTEKAAIDFVKSLDPKFLRCGEKKYSEKT